MAAYDFVDDVDQARNPVKNVALHAKGFAKIKVNPVPLHMGKCKSKSRHNFGTASFTTFWTNL